MKKIAKRKEYIRYYRRRGGWVHAKVIVRGYKWVRIEDFDRTRRRVRIADVRPALWEVARG